VEKCLATSMANAVLPTAVGPAIMMQVFVNDNIFVFLLAFLVGRLVIVVMS